MQTSRKISEFDLGEVLGVGTVGTIYRAVEKASERLGSDQETASQH